MAELRQKMNISNETINAIFVVAFVSFFILSNFTVGFVLPLFIATMFFGALISFLYPRAGLYAIIFLTFIFERFFTLQPVVWGRAEYKLYPLDIIFLAVILRVIIQLVTRKIKFNFKKIDLYLVVFITLISIYFLFSVFAFKTDFALSFSAFKNYAFYSLFYFAIVFLMNKKEHVLRLFKFALAGAIGIVFFIIYGFVSGSGLWSEFTPLSTEGVRTLAFTHAFYLSMALLGVLTYLIFNKNNDATFHSDRSGMYNTALLVLIFIWTIGIIGSMMRHLWIALIFSLAVLYFLLSQKQRKKIKKIFLDYFLIALTVVAIAFYLSSLLPYSDIYQSSASVKNIISQRLGSFFYASGDESFSWRSVVLKEGAKEYLKNPLLGIGLGKAVYIEIGKYKDFVEARNIHNSPFVILIQLGVISFLLLMYFVFKNLKNLYFKIGKDWMDIALLAIIANYLAAFLFQPYLETNMLGIFFWIILGLISTKYEFYETTNTLPYSLNKNNE